MGNVLRLGIARVGLAVNQWRTNRCLSKKTIVILILGLQETGKSTIALRLWKLRKTLPDAHYVQTKGFNTYEIRKKKVTVRLHDLGGHASIRELWQHYYPDAHGVIFVVDSTKPDEAVEAGDVLTEVLRDERMQRKPVLVLLNKQDLPNAATEIDLTKTMDLLAIANSARCFTRVDACAAMDLKDTAIFDGYKWLQTYIEAQYADMNIRVQHDSTIEREKEKAKFALRRSEVRRIREQTSLAVQNGENQPNTTDDEIDDSNGIEEVQKPAEVLSIDGENNIETIPPTATPALVSTVKAKKLQEQISIDQMLEHQQLPPEGAITADKSREDNIIITNVNSSVPSNHNIHLITNINNNNINSQNFIKSNIPNTHNSNSNTDIIQLNHTPINTKSNSNSNSSTSVKHKSGHHRRQSRVINTSPSRNGHDNPAFEHNEDEQTTTTTTTTTTLNTRNNRSNSSSSSHRIIMDKKFSNSKLPIRSSAISIRSNSTETDIEIPGEIILVTTKAEVHETQEMTDDYNKSELKDYDPNEQNESPISYISGHISHRTSQDSIASAVLVVNGDSISELIEQNHKSKSRASSADAINNIEQNNHISKPSKPTPLQKLTNIKSRNKTAPMNDDQLNGNAVKMKKTESATNHNHRTSADIS